MKPAADFLAQAWAEHAEYLAFQGYTPLTYDEPNTVLVPQRVALRAVELAQHFASNYKDMLAKALISASRATLSPETP